MSESYTKQASIGLFAGLPWRERVDHVAPGVTNRPIARAWWLAVVVLGRC
ncbi:hypothetical protein [Massilia pseudoviolaceinigra]|nr:hypothetical protein [Massilia sp. CCM 9206]MDQ1922500.1 hypothetical protein [Massilia sp. CCM 9206]